MVENPPADAPGDPGLIPGSGRSPGGGNGTPLQYFCLENPHGQRSLVGYSPWGRRELDTAERLSSNNTGAQKVQVSSLSEEICVLVGWACSDP